jgi:hypothetical protein
VSDVDGARALTAGAARFCALVAVGALVAFAALVVPLAFGVAARRRAGFGCSSMVGQPNSAGR